MCEQGFLKGRVVEKKAVAHVTSIEVALAWHAKVTSIVFNWAW